MDGYLYAYQLEPIRRAMEEQGIPPTALARNAGYVRSRSDRKNPHGDTTRVKRYLGLAPTTERQPTFPALNRVREDDALRLAEVCGVEPMDLGL